MISDKLLLLGSRVVDSNTSGALPKKMKSGSYGIISISGILEVGQVERKTRNNECLRERLKITYMPRNSNLGGTNGSCMNIYWCSSRWAAHSLCLYVYHGCCIRYCIICIYSVYADLIILTRNKIFHFNCIWPLPASVWYLKSFTEQIIKVFHERPTVKSSLTVQ